MVVASCDTDQMPEPSSAAAAAAPATRVRTIVLSRRGRAQPGSGNGGGGGGGGGGVFGFSVRGGREHGTGFFVSRVEPGSEAQLRGLQVGDQIVRVNGLPVAEALHHELLQLVAQQTRLCLAVRTVGMLPVKDDDHKMMTWQMVTVQPPEPAVSVNGSQDIQLILSVPPGTKLGCGICRGPEWRPGVFVQFTKEGGLARTAGLRAGDQILQCNGVPFTDDFPFSEAVALLKAARQLVLVIRPGAGADLFPSESSGYNSSASSIAGDTSPNPAEKQRLSIVNESPEDRIPSRESLVPEEIKLTSSTNPSTVIHIGPETPSENRNGHIAQVRLVQQQQETKTVLVEVHRADDKPNSSVPCPPPPMNPLAPTPVLSKSDSASSISSFSSALSQEIERRRNQRREGNVVEIAPRRVKLTNVNDEKRHQHEQLMQEFKRAHRKMFSNNAEAGDDGCSHGRSISSEERNSPTNNQVNGDKESVRDRIQNLNSGRYGQSSSPLPPPSPSNSGSPTWSSKRSSFDQSSLVSSGGSTTSFGPPPCPTPDYDTSSLTSSMSASSSADSSKFTNGFGTKLRPVNGAASTIPKAPPLNNMLTKPSTNGSVILQKSVSSTNLSKTVSSTNLTKSVSSTNLKNNSSHIKSSPVMNTKQDSSGASTQNKAPPKMPSDGVEMESLESFELTNPSNPEPRPPETYFPNKRPLSSAASSPKSTISNASTLTNGRKSRPVSVTIGEYPSGSARREPSKFSFLNGTDMPDGNGGHVTDRLQSELMRTLNRSDLKRRTEQESIVNGSANVQPGNPISAKGTVTVSVNAIPVQNSPVRLFEANGNAVLPKTAPAIRNVAEKLNGSLNGSLNGTNTGNRVTIRVGSEPSGHLLPCGILKHTSNRQSPLRSMVQQKNITFGEITTVIQEIRTPHS